MEIDIPWKWSLKTSRNRYSHDQKAGLKSKLIRKYKEGSFTLIRGTIQQEDITIVNISTPNIDASNYIKQILLNLQTQRDPNTIILNGFNIPLSPLDRASRHKVSKEFSDTKNTINQTDLTAISKCLFVSSKNSQIHCLLSCSWNLLQNQPYFRPQTNS